MRHLVWITHGNGRSSSLRSKEQPSIGGVNEVQELERCRCDGCASAESNSRDLPCSRNQKWSGKCHNKEDNDGGYDQADSFPIRHCRV